MIYRFRAKRLFDIIFGIIGVALAGPLILLAWTAVRLASPGPGFFCQTRVGLGGRMFRIVKLRTMYPDKDRILSQTTDGDPDVLLVGSLLRRLKIDELPQIFNILVGDMSFVGPRPCMPVTVAEMPAWARQRFLVRPGLTGLAQVSGNVSLSWEERWRYDVAYVDECSFWLDLKIILKTVGVILLGERRFRRPR